MGTRGAWAADLARALGNSAPTASTLNWISAWTAGENTRAKYNPLATSLDYGTNTAFNYLNGNPLVRNYMTRQQGIEATVKTLQGPFSGYQDIREGIAANDPERAANGLINAPWGTNGGFVKRLWQTRDVRDELLLSEGDNEGSTSPVTPSIPGAVSTPKNTPRDTTQPVQTIGQIRDTGPRQGPQIGGSPYTGDTRQTVSTAEGTPVNIGTPYGNVTLGVIPPNFERNVMYIVGGSALVLIAIILAVKQYIPTRQIVETIAAAA